MLAGSRTPPAGCFISLTEPVAEFGGTLLACDEERTSQKASETKGSAKGAPFLSLEERTSRDRDLVGPAGKAGPSSCCARTPLAPPLLSTRAFLFSAADPAVCCSCRLDFGPLLAAGCCLETTASHSTTPSGFLGTQGM